MLRRCHWDYPLISLNCLTYCLCKVKMYNTFAFTYLSVSLFINYLLLWYRFLKNLQIPFPSNRQHLRYGDCLEGKRRDYLTSSVLLCIIIVYIICIPI